MPEWISWGQFEAADPELASFGRQRLTHGVAYLASVRAARLPRVHPVQPIVSDQRLLMFMFPSSPKAHDLRRDGRYALHNAVADVSGSGGEFFVRGYARLNEDPAVRREATESGYTPLDEYILFEFSLSQALANEYIDGHPNYRRWNA